MGRLYRRCLNDLVAIAMALACALTYGVADYCGGRASRTLASVVVTVTGQVVSLALIAAALAFYGGSGPTTDSWRWGLVGGLAGAVGLACFYHALARGVMSVVAPTTAVVAVIIPILVGLAQGERPRIVGYVGMGVAVISVALVSGALNRHGGGVSPTVMAAAVVAGLGFGFLFVCLERAGDDSGLWPLLPVRLASVTLIGLLVVVSAVRGAAPFGVEGAGPAVRLAVAAGVLDMGANVLYLEAVRRGDLSTVGVVSSLYPVSTTALALLLDRERVTRWQTAGMLLAAVAVVLVATS
jgi:drug/metabolite transporter (DMT)-like permease